MTDKGEAFSGGNRRDRFPAGKVSMEQAGWYSVKKGFHPVPKVRSFIEHCM